MVFDSHFEFIIWAAILEFDCNLVAILNYFCKYFSANEFIGPLNLLFNILHDFLAVTQDEILSFT